MQCDKCGSVLVYHDQCMSCGTAKKLRKALGDAHDCLADGCGGWNVNELLREIEAALETK